MSIIKGVQKLARSKIKQIEDKIKNEVSLNYWDKLIKNPEKILGLLSSNHGVLSQKAVGIVSTLRAGKESDIKINFLKTYPTGGSIQIEPNLSKELDLVHCVRAGEELLKSYLNTWSSIDPLSIKIMKLKCDLIKNGLQTVNLKFELDSDSNVLSFSRVTQKGHPETIYITGFDQKGLLVCQLVYEFICQSTLQIPAQN